MKNKIEIGENERLTFTYLMDVLEEEGIVMCTQYSSRDPSRTEYEVVKAFDIIVKDRS